MLRIFTILVLLTGVVFADTGWTFEKVLYQTPDTEITNSYGMHGVAVDGAGNIWTAMHNFPTDSIVTATDTLHIYGCRVFSPDGTELAMSPVNILTGALVDTLTSSAKGLATDHNGDILLSVAGGLYRINHLTGEGMNFYDYPEYTGSLTKAAVDENGNIYIGTVGKGNPVKILNPDFSEKGNAIEDFSSAYNRAVAVTPDGKDLYLGSTWNGMGISHFHSDIPGVLPHIIVDTLGYAVLIEGVIDTTEHVTFDTTIVGTDTTITSDTTYTYSDHVENMWPEDVTLSPDGKIYAANTQIDFGVTPYRGSRWWVYDQATGEELYSLGKPEGDPASGGVWNGRGAAWSADGTKMYLADFGYCNVTVWSSTVGIGEDTPHVLSTFELMQNFPNPFNPTTSIPYTLDKQAKVELKVFSVTGELVSTLLNEVKTSGEHNYMFDGSQLASGTYIYQLKIDNKVQSKRMILIK